MEVWKAEAEAGAGMGVLKAEVEAGVVMGGMGRRGGDS